MAQCPDDPSGNREAARQLWGYNYGNRVQWLRAFTRFLADTDLTNQNSLVAWAQAGSYRRDFEGRVPGLGLAAYQWLLMRLGVDTAKPDSRLRSFIEPVVGHPVNDLELIRGVEEAAGRMGVSVRRLDAGIWELQLGAPGAI